jgi:hypothetical protein
MRISTRLIILQPQSESSNLHYWEEKDMTFRMNRAFLAILAVFFMLLLKIAAAAGPQGGAMPEYSNCDCKTPYFLSDFLTLMHGKLFVPPRTTNPSGTDKLSLKVNPPIPQTRLADASGGAFGPNPVIGSTTLTAAGKQKLQDRIDQDKKRLDQDMALLLPGENSKAAGAELLKLIQDFADQTGVNINRRNNLPEKKMQGLTKVLVTIDTTCDTEQLVRFLVAIENCSKYLKIEDLAITSFLPPALKEYEIRPGLNVAGYIQSIDSEMPAQGAAGNQAETLEAKIKSLENILCNKDMNLDILQELTLILPIDTYLINYANRNGTIQLVGVSGCVSDLIQILDKSPFFKDVVFKAPSRPRPEGGDLFNIEAKLKR